MLQCCGTVAPEHTACLQLNMFHRPIASSLTSCAQVLSSADDALSEVDAELMADSWINNSSADLSPKTEHTQDVDEPVHEGVCQGSKPAALLTSDPPLSSSFSLQTTPKQYPPQSKTGEQQSAFQFYTVSHSDLAL